MEAMLEDGDEVEYLNPYLSYPIKATFRQYVEGWAEIEFWDHSATNPSTAIVRPSRIRKGKELLEVLERARIELYRRAEESDQPLDTELAADIEHAITKAKGRS